MFHSSDQYFLDLSIDPTAPLDTWYLDGIDIKIFG